MFSGRVSKPNAESAGVHYESSHFPKTPLKCLTQTPKVGFKQRIESIHQNYQDIRNMQLTNNKPPALDDPIPLGEVQHQDLDHTKNQTIAVNQDNPLIADDASPLNPVRSKLRLVIILTALFVCLSPSPDYQLWHTEDG